MREAVRATSPGSARLFWITLALLGVVLFATAIPGVFTIDEPHYISTLLALREGRLTVPGTENLPPNRELAWFDPTGASRVISSTPVAPNAPPLWAPLALPFSMLGWRGLVLLNLGAFLLTIALVFRVTSRLSGSVAGGVWAASAVALGGYAIEYSQGVWPHCLSMALTFTAVVLTLRAIAKTSALSAAGAGWLAGIAMGVRYQNAVVLVALAAAVLIRSRMRTRLLLALVLGAALPLGASSIINHLRLESWNPISKGPGYLAVPAASSATQFGGNALTMLWARVGDYAARPMGPDMQWMTWIERGEGGALLVLGVVKKSLLQSSPWIVLALAAAAALFWSKRHRGCAQGDVAWITLLLSAFLLTALSMAGPGRDDGLGFNQRYLLDLLAPLAVCFGLALARISATRIQVLVGCLAGLGLAAIPLSLPSQCAAHQWLIRGLPLLLGGVLAAVWCGKRAIAATLVAPIAAAAIGWALAIQLSTDLGASRALRSSNQNKARAVTTLVPAGAALVTWSGMKDCLGSIVLVRDQTVIDAANDSAENVNEVVDALLRRGDRVFLWLEAMPPRVHERILNGREVRVVGRLDNGRTLCEEVR